MHCSKPWEVSEWQQGSLSNQASVMSVSCCRVSSKSVDKYCTAVYPSRVAVAIKYDMNCTVHKEHQNWCIVQACLSLSVHFHVALTSVQITQDAKDILYKCMPLFVRKL